MKKCLNGWVYGNYNFKTKFSGRDIEYLSEMLISCNIRRPTELHRAIRPLKNLKFWKGSEYRTFLLYLGPVLLKDILAGPVYQNYIYLFCATTILSCSAYLKHIDVAEKLLFEFTKTFSDLYGKDAIGSNVHNLCHVVNDVKKFGSLTDISAYPFENFLFSLKSLVRTGNRPLAQIAKRLTEMQSLKIDHFFDLVTPYATNEISKKKRESSAHAGYRLYKTIYVSENIMLSNNIKNKWFMTTDNIIIELMYVMQDKEGYYVYGAGIKNYADFFILPFKSSNINIYECKDKSKNDFSLPKSYRLDQIKCKLFAIEWKDKLVFFPLLHTLII